MYRRRGTNLKPISGEEFLECVDLLVEAEERNEENDIRLINLSKLP
jgi:hypothetical protein